MDPIDSVSRAMQLLRRRLAGHERPASGPHAAPAASPAAGDRNVRQTVLARLEALDPADSGYADRAAEAFVESVLLAEFGSDMTNDPRFRQLILGVARDMRAEPETARDLERLLKSLRID